MASAALAQSGTSAVPPPAAGPVTGKGGNAQDTLVFGNPKSEQAHALVSDRSAVFQNELTLFGPGNLWDNKDVLIFRQQKISGDGWIQSRITSTGEASDWTKVDVTFRESLDADAKNAFMFDTNGQGIHAQWRKDTGGSTGQSARLTLPSAPPYWVRAERKGDQFILSASADGKTWIEASTQEISMGKNIFVGLVNSAAAVEKMNYAIFDSITTSNPSATAWTESNVGESPIKGGSMVNGLGEPSRRMLPQEPAYYCGGELTFKMKVEPTRQNYLTAKVWRSDGSSTIGRIILNCEGKEVGMRHGSGLDHRRSKKHLHTNGRCP